MFVSYEEKGYYRVVSVGQLTFDCRLYCGRSRRMQGDLCNTGAVLYQLSYQATGSCALSEFVIYPSKMKNTSEYMKIHIFEPRESYADMIDHRSHAHNLNSCEIKA